MKMNPDYKSRFRILKGGKISLVVSALLGSMTLTFAAPSGESVVSGDINIDRSIANTTNINQGSQKSIINWQNFNIAGNEIVNFNMPSSTSSSLNRVIGNNPSQIYGKLNSNGQVFLINQNGVYFGQNSQVNTAGFVASTKNISDENFLNSNYIFEGNSEASIINFGTITTDNAYTALLAKTVENEGVIKATLGRVELASGEKITLDINGNSLVKLSIDKGTLDALVKNKGLIQANGGEVYMTTQALDEVLNGLVNNTGHIQANTFEQKDGKIILFAHGGTGEFGGTIEAENGFVETSGKEFVNKADLKVQTAQWLIDPVNITIDNTLASTISTALNSANVTITTDGNNTPDTTSGESGADGDITVNSAITKTSSSATNLTLKAHNNININQEIKSTSGRLNVELIADQDGDNAGDVNFGTTGSVTTNDGNFYVGSVSGTYDTVTATAQNFTMADGSFVDVGSGNLDINVKNDITLPNNSEQTNTYSLVKSRVIDSSYYVYFNSGTYLNRPSSNLYHKISLTAGGNILGGNIDETLADIITAGEVAISANGHIGTNINAIKIEGSENAGYSHTATADLYNPFPNYAQSLSVTNTLGNTYIAEINKQIFGSIGLNVDSSTTGTQNINIMDDAGSNGTGHITAEVTNGLLSVATDGINTKGAKRTSHDANNAFDDYDYDVNDLAVYPTSVKLSAPTIELADNAIVSESANYRRVSGSSTWSYTYTPTLSLSATTFLASDAAMINSTYETTGFGTVNLSGQDIGDTTNALEISTGTLNIYNTGGDTYLANTSYGTLNFDGVNTAGVHYVLSSNGDFFNVKTGQDVNSNNTLDGLLVETISGSSDGSNWNGSTGIHTATQFDATGSNNNGTGINRNVGLSARSGGIIFDDDSVNVGGANFTATIPNNSSGDGRLIRSLNSYDANNQSAQITAGNVYLNNNVNDTSIPISIGGGNYHLQIARGSGTAVESSLSLTSTAGEVNIHELTQNHFKTINTTLNNSNVAQDIYIDLAGDDHIQYSDTGSRVFLDADKVKLDSYNRNWNFNATNRHVQLGELSNSGAAANTLGTGFYTVNTSRLYLDSDVLTDGSALRLTGSQIHLLKDVRIDSNADDTSNSASSGDSGSIYLSGEISGASSNRKIVIDSSSDTTSGNAINMYSSLGNGGGHYLTDFRITSKGSTDTNDGTINFNGYNYNLNGNFYATGNSYLSRNTTIDTEQGNTNDAGNITFDGYRLTGNAYYSNTFNTATTASGKNGGNIDLYNTYSKSELYSSTMILDATGGANGNDGSMYLPAINTANNTQRNIDISGGDVVLYGDLKTNWGDITLNGDIQLANTLSFDTWSSTYNRETATAGAVTVNGSLFALNNNVDLTIDTSTDTGNNYYNLNSSTPYSHSAGAVSINGIATNNTLLDNLTITTQKAGDYNNGTNSSITVSNVATQQDQSYTGGTTTISGDIQANQVTIATITDGSTVSGNGKITANTLVLNGLNTTYDLTAQNSGNSVDSLSVSGANGITFANRSDIILNGIAATDIIDLSTTTGDITIDGNIVTDATTSDAITLNAGKSESAPTSTGGDIIYTSGDITTGTNGGVRLFTGSIESSTGVSDLVASNDYKKYNADETTAFDPALGSGTYVVYREKPAVVTTTPTTTPSQEVQNVINSISNNFVNTTQNQQTQNITNIRVQNSNVTEKNPDIMSKRVQSVIVNNNATPQTQNNQQVSSKSLSDTIKSVAPELSGSSSTFTVVSKADGNTAVTKLTMEDLGGSSQSTDAVNVNEVRVALAPDSFVELVNGGVKLPDGVSQEFYVVEDK